MAGLRPEAPAIGTGVLLAVLPTRTVLVLLMAGLRDVVPTPRRMGVLPPPFPTLGNGLNRVLRLLAALVKAGRLPPPPLPFLRALAKAGRLPVDLAALPAGGIGVSAGGLLLLRVLGMQSLRRTPMILETSALALARALRFFLEPLRRRDRWEAPSVMEYCWVLNPVPWLVWVDSTDPTGRSAW